MLHMGMPGVPGKTRAEIDADYDKSYQAIADACGTKNPLR
jgi:hypothetical protein